MSTSSPTPTPTSDRPADRAVRVALGAVGAAGAAYGLYLLLGQPLDRLVNTVLWAGGAVVAHDAVIAPVVLVLGVLAARRAPDWLRVPIVRLLVVLGPLTLVAVPVLGRFGARPDNPTLLDRPYWAAYLVIVLVAIALTTVDAVRRRHASAGASTPP
jgi:hypothetical protein